MTYLNNNNYIFFFCRKFIINTRKYILYNSHKLYKKYNSSEIIICNDMSILIINKAALC